MSTFLESPAIPSSPSPLLRAARHLSKYDIRRSRAVIARELRSSTVVAADSTFGFK